MSAGTALSPPTSGVSFFHHGILSRAHFLKETQLFPDEGQATSFLGAQGKPLLWGGQGKALGVPLLPLGARLPLLPPPPAANKASKSMAQVKPCLWGHRGGRAPPAPARERRRA